MTDGLAQGLFPDVDVRQRTDVERRIDVMKNDARKLEELGQHEKVKRLRSKIKTMERRYTSRGALNPGAS